MNFHKTFLEYQADHPTVTWVVWAIIWGLVFVLFIYPKAAAWMDGQPAQAHHRQPIQMSFATSQPGFENENISIRSGLLDNVWIAIVRR